VQLSWAELLLLVAVVSASYGWLVVKQLMVAGHGILQIQGVSMLVGGLLAVITAGCFEYGTYPLVTNLYDFAWYMAALILVANIVCYNLYSLLLRRYSAIFISFAGFTCPLFAALYGGLFLDEPMTGSFCASAVMVTGGLYLFYRQELREKPAIKHIYLQGGGLY
jgi:drug/metabolite transporter (DMT)-like permease